MKGGFCPLFHFYLYQIYMEKFKRNLFWILPFCYLLVALFATNRNYFLPPSAMENVACNVTQYNNYVIFKNSFFHLINHDDLYQSFPNEQYDLFKYTPTFSFFFGVLAYLPDYLGLLIWNLLNVFLPLWGIHKLFGLNTQNKTLLSFLLLPELFTTVLNSQSNGLILGLLLLAFSYIQQNRTPKAVLFILLTAFIKLFGAFFFAIFLLYPKQLKNAVKSGFLYGLTLFLLPALIVNWDFLLKLYQSYFQLLKNDGTQFVKLSVIGWINQWFNFYPSKNLVLFIGFIIQMIPLLICRAWQNQSKLIYAMTLLIWMVIFNHMAESATFIIAVGAIFVAFASFEKIPSFYWLLLILVVFTTELGPSDIYPKYMRVWIVETAQLKVFPCILVWISLIIYLVQPNKKLSEIIR